VLALLAILISDIGPIFAIAATGYFFEKRFGGSAGALAKISFNVMSPCLVFNQLMTSKIAGADAGRMALFGALLVGAMGAAAWLAGKALRLDRRMLSSFLLVVMFSNSGNYALPLILFAFGREALAYASVNFVTSAVIVYTAGVLIADGGGRGIRSAVTGLARVPTLYALAAAGVLLAARVDAPVWLMRPAGMLGDAALPLMILGLGMQLRLVSMPTRPAAVAAAVLLSLVVGPVAGYLLTGALGIVGAARNASMVLSAMPSAVITTVLALEFDLDSAFITSVVFATTLLSPLTLAVLIAYLRG
jgi:predicted permease